MKTITERIAEPRLIIIDGGTGTEMEKRGARMEEKGWSASSSLTEPHLLKEIHQDYIDAGAEVIITNSYACSKHVMERCGLGDRFVEANSVAAQIAGDVRDHYDAPHQVWVAGSMSPATFWADRPDEKTARLNFVEQANILADNGIDFFMLEMLRDVEQSLYIFEAVKQTGLPVVLGFSTHRETNGEIHLGLEKGEQSFADLFPLLDLTNVPLVNIMHTLIKDISPSLEALKSYWSGPTGVYAHYGEFVMPNWIFNDMITPAAYAEAVQTWVDEGVRLVGGCCGIGPEHIRELTRRFR